MEEKIEKLSDIVVELYSREVCNNCNRFRDKGYVELCDIAIGILKDLKS